MFRPTMDKKTPGTQGDFKIVPHVSAESSMRFFIPQTLTSDYNNFLMTEVPGVNYTFTVHRNWYDQFEEDYSATYIRASYFPIDWKSKIGNSDMGSNFFANTEVDIKKGDIVVREDGQIYILDWKVQRKPNIQNTQAKDCNMMLEIHREVDEVLDNRGYVVMPKHRECIVPSIPCVLTVHSGRPDFSVAYNTPGIHSDNLFDGWVQWNAITQKIKVGDVFPWGDEMYKIAHTHISEVDIDGSFGILNISARRVAGGAIGGE